MSDSVTKPEDRRTRARVVLVSPADARANNGNWRTAHRWRRWLSTVADVALVDRWRDEPATTMVALHARRSADSIARFAATGGPTVVVLTGTDLYRDIDVDRSARASLDHATRLVVLNRLGVDRLPAFVRPKTVVIEQSAPRALPLPPRRRTFDALFVGHLRPEKDPLTVVRALARIDEPRLRLVHVGRADDPVTGPAFAAGARRDRRIELLGPRPHAATRRLIRRARVLVVSSLIEGGANVVIEATQSDVPVLASRIDGNVGLLGDDHPGLFPPGDDAALARLLRRCIDEPAFCDALRAAAGRHRDRFEPAREAARVRALVHNPSVDQEAP